MINKTIAFIRKTHGVKEGFIPLHAPVFSGQEKEYILNCIDSTFVSSVGQYVDRFEKMVAEYTGANNAIATMNGTAALHIALLLAGVKPQDEVITQAVSFVATANAITYCGAAPVFLDSDRSTLGLCPEALAAFLGEETLLRSDGFTYNKQTGRKISGCVPMHVFGHAAKIERIQSICEEYNISLVEDAAESLGSFYRGRHTGTFGKLGIVSFNGNKIITTGGGGMILTDDDKLGQLAKHLTTTAKVDHPWEFVHDQVGYNYRMPNINAALGCAQLEELDSKLARKRKLAERYGEFFRKNNTTFVAEPEGGRSNYWLNAIVLQNQEERDEFLQISNREGVITRPLWKLLPDLTMFQHCQSDGLAEARWLQDRIVNIPSSEIL